SSTPFGGVPEWLNGAVSKTVVGFHPTVGSNPTPSARSKPGSALQAARFCLRPGARLARLGGRSLFPAQHTTQGCKMEREDVQAKLRTFVKTELIRDPNYPLQDD